MRRYLILLLLAVLVGTAGRMSAAKYCGRVVDRSGAPLMYATVYPEIAPECGSATNDNGYFSFEANLPNDSCTIIISYIGYEKKTVFAEDILFTGTQDKVFTIVLKEQPIALQEMVVTPSGRLRSKRKQMKNLLERVYERMKEDFSDDNAQYQVVSDVHMSSSDSTWGVEQMIADIVVLPKMAEEGKDSIQFHGRHCKRFFDAHKRAQADSLLAGNAIEKMERGHRKKIMRRAANSLDSGVVAHKRLFALGNIRYDFEQAMRDTRHWIVSNESDNEIVLTHTETMIKYLGCFRMTFKRHYIIDSQTYSVRGFSEHADITVTIPFGIKLNKEQLQMLNLLNMDEHHIERFKLKKILASLDLNTIYQHQNGYIYILEKNMIVNAHILGDNQSEIPIYIEATQRVTGLQTKDVQPFTKDQITRRVKREIVSVL